MLILLVGKPKTGKTVSAATFPKPMLYLDFDGGFTSVKHARNKAGELIIKESDTISHVPFVIPEYHELSFKTAESSDFRGGIAPDYTKNAIELMKKYNQTIRELYADTKGIQTLVIDSLTVMFRIWKDMIMAMNKLPALRISDYGTLEGLLFKQFLPSLKNLNQKIPWVILIDHEDMDKDENTGALVEFPIGPSRAMGQVMSDSFDEIWRQRIEGGEYVWKTRAHGFFQSAGSRHHLPETIKPATYTELQKHLK